MNFLTRLSRNLRTIEEIELEKNTNIANEIHRISEELLNLIRMQLLDAAQCGLYEETTNGKTIFCICALPDTLQQYLKEDINQWSTPSRNTGNLDSLMRNTVGMSARDARKYLRQHPIVIGKTIPGEYHKETTYSLVQDIEPKLESVIGELKMLAVSDGIKLELVMCNKWNNNCFNLPYTFFDESVFKNDYVLALKCYATIHEEQIENKADDCITPKEEFSNNEISHISHKNDVLKNIRIKVQNKNTNLSKKQGRAVDSAQRMYEQVKFRLLDAYNMKEYQVVNGEMLFNVMCEFPQIYLKNFNIKATRNTVIFSIASEYSEECDYMTMQLRKYFETENIKVKMRVMEKRTKKDYKFSKEYRHISNNKKDYVLAILCTYTMPVPVDGLEHRSILGVNLLPSFNNDAIKIQWNKIPEAKLYEIWRYDNDNTKAIIGTTDRNATLFTDRDILSTAQYNYQVVCICVNGYTIESPVETIIFDDNSYDIMVDVKKNQDVDSMDGHEFEKFCGDLLSCNDFENVDVTRGSGDQGIDIIAYKDGVKFGIQCKCYSFDIGNKAVQEAYAGKKFYDCHVGVVLTNRYFTKSAKELAQKSGILLWDRDRLLKMAENLK